MIAPLLALSMLALLGQQHTTQNGEAPPAATRPPADAEAADAADSAEAAEAAEAAAAEAEAAAAEAAAEADEDEGEVCHRRTTYDDFGRRRTRRVCTPR